MKKLISILILTFCIINIYAIDKNAGEKGFVFTKLPTVTAIAGMAGTGEMLQNSPISFMHHPAAFDWQRGASVGISNTMWLVDTNMYTLAYRNIMFNKGFGFGIKYFDLGEFEKRTDNGTLIGHYHPVDINLVTNYTHKLTPDIHAGINLHMMYEKIDSSSAIGIYTDLGVAYLTPIAHTTIDFAIKNLGVSSKMDKEKIEIPLISDIGITSGFQFSEDFAIYPAFKITYMSDHDDLLPAFGIDFRLFDILSIRCGYKFNYNAEDFSAGMGIKYRNFTVDYSYLNFNEDVGSVNMIGLGYRF